MSSPLWYNFLLTLIKPLYRLRVKQRFGHLPDYQQEIDERFGHFQPVKNKNTIWFHAVSVGETNAAQPLIEHYLKQGQAVLITNTTRTGQVRVKSLFAQNYPDLFQAVFLPIDQKALIETFIQQNQPRILLLMETELWPNLLECVHQQGIPQLLLNARLSEKSAKGYDRFRRLTVPMLQQLNWIAAQDQATLDRFHHLGKAQNEMSVVGNVKFDITAPEHFIQQARQLRQDWQLQQRKILVLASTHAPEEQQILAALAPALSKDKSLLCIVVPRHPERFDEVFQSIQKLALIGQRRSLGQAITVDTQVYLADSMGELWLWYALAQVAYVGGSLNEPGGGHNILEPIALNVVTLLGKNYFNFQNIVDEFVQHGAVKIVQNADEAAQTLLDLLDNQVQRQQMNQQAQQILTANQGAVARHISLIERFLAQ
ncbi:3-deoxy-D-manno-octulosonic acid transferase [Acinetobacter puyangensis]|uniref:3-deoxy-D-manno-octulosonic acid transferase n=1 Tax=Acinetobacter puyangensis TaxID=1096779 RepID=A0A240EDM3_9GAMM|nr:3-deoxy-D-manno-octulosonic acid transferase [Acinetobacter puyangensis]SNX46015.1 3-deoxy-D-manno-octulosonic-acid transferase [Acinetobacter puyangensis]